MLINFMPWITACERKFEVTMFEFQTSCWKGMAKEPTNCCPVAGIGLNFLTPTSPSRPLLDLLGLTDLQLQEYLAEGHPYGFILGHGRNTAFKDYKEAAKFLMERNIPDIAQDQAPAGSRIFNPGIPGFCKIPSRKSRD